MPAPVSRFAADFKSGWHDRAKVLSDWAGLSDKQFRAKYHVDPETAQKVLGNRPLGKRSFRERVRNDPQAAVDWQGLTLSEFEKKYQVNKAYAAEIMGTRVRHKPNQPARGGARNQKKPHQKTWLELHREQAKADALALEKERKAAEKAYGKSEGDPADYVRAVGL